MENEFQGPVAGDERGVEVSIYNVASGRIVASGRYRDIAEAWLNVEAGQSFILGMYDPDLFDVIDGVPVELPPSPSGRHYYDWHLNSWIDSWTESKWTAELHKRREAASMSRIDFVLICVSHGILSESDAEVAVDGGFPQAFQDIIDTMPIEERFEARIRWKGAQIIDRMNPLIYQMAAAINIDEWTLDIIFGVQWPDPIAAWPEGQLHP